jgi:ABC-2 type transport system permease protein
VWTSLTVALYILLGWSVFGVSLANVNWPAAAIILTLTIIVLSGIGVTSASFVLVFKRGDPLGWLVDSLTWLIGGVLYPVSVLPPALRVISGFFPIKYAIDGMRAAVLQKASWAQLWGSIWPLMVFAGLILPISLVGFHVANRWIRTVGSMSEY